LSGVAFLFPGQGAQFVGMGQALAESLPAARQLYERAADVLGYDLAQVCWQGPEAKLNSTVYSQPALFVTSLAALEVLRRDKPEIVDHCRLAAGLSLGEYTAMTFAGVLDFESGLRVVQRRGEAMQAAADARASGMVSILGLEVPQIATLCQQARQADEVLQVANLLCPGNTVVSGDLSACQRLAELATAAGAMKVIPLQVAGAFHTSIMDSATEKLRAALAQIQLAAPRVPVISNVDAEAHADPEQIRELLIRQVVSPVQWEATMRQLVAQGVTQFFEIGPGRVLVGLLRRIDRKLSCENIAC
jgi:[acyl-carrier-protein] S-malonyltransferase